MFINCGGGGGGGGGDQTPSYKVSFYDSNLDLLASFDLRHEVNQADLDSNATTHSVSGWYQKESATAETAFSTTLNSDINFYALPNVHEITDQTELNAVRNDLSGKYILLNDIALSDSGAGVDTTNGWNPIGESPNLFTGLFNGNNHEITNLWINRAGANYIGLFGRISGANIRNLGVEIPAGKEVKGQGSVGGIAGIVYYGSTISNSYAAGSVSGTDSVGGIAGYVSSSTISNSYAEGNISGRDLVGGIAGDVYNSSISNSYSTGSINGSYYVGGIAGYVSSSTISNSYAEGNISGTNYVGGIAGYVHDNSISNSYAEGNISGYYYVGGIAGHVESGSITNSYAAGSVSGINNYVGGIAGFAYNAIISNSNAAGSVNGTNYVGGVAGKVENSSNISNSYSIGNISGKYHVGGIAGHVESSSITNSYAAGSVSGINNFVGGIAGYIYSSGTIRNNAAINPSVTAAGGNDKNRVVGYISGTNTVTNNFALSTMQGTFSGGNGGTSKTIGELKTQSTYSAAINGDGAGGLGWKFGGSVASPWKIEASKNNGLPYLYWQEL